MIQLLIRYPNGPTDQTVVADRNDAVRILGDIGECTWHSHLFDPDRWAVRVTKAGGSSAVAIAEVWDDAPVMG